MYDYTAFPDDELSLGYSISVFQESIGQHIVEYLVNFDFFRRVMENYGFVLMNREEATQFGFPNGSTGMFEGLYYDMMAETTRESTNRYGTAPEMTEDEKFISFLNRYFIFRKVRHVAAEKITNLIEDKMPSVEPSKCKTAAASVAAVKYQDEYPLEEEEGINKIAKDFEKREALATKETENREKVREKAREKTKGEKNTEPVHFIRPLGDAKITIRVYDPLIESNPNEPVEITDLPIEGPSIQLVPNTIRIGKTIRVPKQDLKKTA
jgi:hypothetical protein